MLALTDTPTHRILQTSVGTGYNSIELKSEGRQIHVLFSHSGWNERSDFMARCSTKWAVFLLSLKRRWRQAKVSCIRTIFILFMMNKLSLNLDGISESIWAM